MFLSPSDGYGTATFQGMGPRKGFEIANKSCANHKPGQILWSSHTHLSTHSCSETVHPSIFSLGRPSQTLWVSVSRTLYPDLCGHAGQTAGIVVLLKILTSIPSTRATRDRMRYPPGDPADPKGAKGCGSCCKPRAASFTLFLSRDRKSLCLRN